MQMRSSWQPVTQEMFLPRAEKGEKLLVVQHPSFYAKPNYEFTYDRNPRSTAAFRTEWGGIMSAAVSMAVQPKHF